tara:strand:- start:175 stop:342 length:168 start_codon:yes stop_codon:yes gene_type:complete
VRCFAVFAWNDHTAILITKGNRSNLKKLKYKYICKIIDYGGKDEEYFVRFAGVIF